MKMNDRSWLHRSKNNQPNQRSTYCRTDNTLAADEVSHSDSHPPPATRGCHPPPEAMHSLKGKPETGMDAAGIYPKLTIRFPYGAPFDCWISLFHRASEPPGLLCVPHVPLSPCPHVPSRLRRALVNVSTCQPVPSRKRVCPMSPCPLAHMSPRDLWSRSGSAIQLYDLTPCSAP